MSELASKISGIPAVGFFDYCVALFPANVGVLELSTCTRFSQSIGSSLKTAKSHVGERVVPRVLAGTFPSPGDSMAPSARLTPEKTARRIDSR